MYKVFSVHSSGDASSEEAHRFCSLATSSYKPIKDRKVAAGAVRDLIGELVDEGHTGFVYLFNIAQDRMLETHLVEHGKSSRWYRKIEGQGCPFK